MPLPRVKARGMPNAPSPLLTKEGNEGGPLSPPVGEGWGEGGIVNY